MPEVSVIMGVCNGARFLGATVASLQAQTFTDWELVVVDNGSTDGGMAAVLAGRPDARIRVFTFPEKLGPGPALAEACREARGRYLAVLDADDIALPRRLEIQRAYLELRPEVVMLGTGSELIDVDGNALGLEPQAGTPDDILALTGYVCALRHSSVMFRRELLARIQYRAVLGNGADHDFMARAAEGGRIEVLPATLCRYRLHAQNHSRLKDKGAISRGLVCMLAHRRRHGLPEDYAAWEKKFADGMAASPDDARGANLFCAKLFAAEGRHDLAAFHAWQAMRAGARVRGALSYAGAVLRGLAGSRGLARAVFLGWLKEPAHQLLRTGGVPDRPQF